MLNVAPQTERNPGHSGAMAGASKAADAVDATGSLSVGALAVPDSGRLEACSINRPPTGGDLTFSWKEGHICTVVLLEVLSQLCHGGGGVQALSVVGGRQSRTRV